MEKLIEELFQNVDDSRFEWTLNALQTAIQADPDRWEAEIEAAVKKARAAYDIVNRAWNDAQETEMLNPNVETKAAAYDAYWVRQRAWTIYNALYHMPSDIAAAKEQHGHKEGNDAKD